MFSGFAAALSGIQAGTRILGASAHNIANAQTDNFKRTQTTLTESSAGGVVVSLSQDVRPGVQFLTGDDPFLFPEPANVDVGQEIINTVAATHLVEANIASAQTQDTTLGSLLDILE